MKWFYFFSYYGNAYGSNKHLRLFIKEGFLGWEVSGDRVVLTQPFLKIEIFFQLPDPLHLSTHPTLVFYSPSPFLKNNPPTTHTQS